ncbi:Wax ester synthase/acyl-CoA:diacylglycerol acyltransferase [[Actinomadura] parvosata subsp. kistnae]|uniref:diacylglycerol O-acyltransferase n=1 Tax=[Actinomadura] parvosata subsp. kistnae TaxID=1909395 RepID=A0A1U9ZRK6_9ACTN|nr:wax ester/triacylglycerol synthase domain-containing protein [Nonomuraea sp. ATCC 55076]AQZ60586.1 hypothetical protein BKM31_02815 [Nonomuraea sp. ATCC 55076]SPL90837.1 Wax ester synthase/acyl-CoA:diacylglycerol acyltransferase [Actinomadura parvosata subsp. kistnae]
MRQLTALDAQFLNVETPTTAAHVAGLAILDPADGAVTRSALAELLLDRIHLSPALSLRLAEVPLRLDHPYWAADPDFDLDHHLFETTLPEPGDHWQLADTVAQLHARRLDRAHPLWEMHLIHGLNDGLVAVYTKVHHAAIDGISGAETLATLLDLTPDGHLTPRRHSTPVSESAEAVSGGGANNGESGPARGRDGGAAGGEGGAVGEGGACAGVAVRGGRAGSARAGSSRSRQAARDARPDGTGLHDAHPDNARPNGAHPNNASPNDAHPNGASPNGACLNNASPDGGSLNDARPNDARLSGAHPDDALPNGAHPNGASPNDVHPTGAHPNGASPNDTSPNDTSPNDTSPNGANPDDVSLIGASPDDTGQVDSGVGSVGDEAPGLVGMLAGAVLRSATQPVRAVRSVVRAAGDLDVIPVVGGLPGARLVARAARMVGREGQRRPELPSLAAPRTPFNGPISARRHLSFGSVSLKDVKKVAKANGVSVNDVVMTLCTSALRSWLCERDALPEAPLVVGVPVAVRKAQAKDLVGNQISAMVAPVPTHLSDPKERLREVGAAMGRAKRRFAVAPATWLSELCSILPTPVTSLATPAIFRLAGMAFPPINLIISNVPGPQFPLYLCGGRILSYYPLSVLTDLSGGLNITCFSYDGMLDFGIVACPERVDDVWGLLVHLRTALDELLDERVGDEFRDGVGVDLVAG